MAQIHPRGKAQNKRIQFNAPADLVDEFTAKKEQLFKIGLTIDLTEDFIKVLRDGIKTIDKKLGELGSNGAGEITESNNQQTTA